MRSALSNVKILEFGDYISVPYCAKLLGDLGAEIIKIETPYLGDRSRHRGPFLGDIPGIERSGFFSYLNTNKRGVTLNIETCTGKTIFKKLVEQTDVLLEDTTASILDSLDIGYNELRKINPKLVMTSITPFGQSGPYKKFKGADLTSWHMGGLGIMTPMYPASPENPPLRWMQISSFLTAELAATATMTALFACQTQGIGQHVDVSQLESIFFCLGFYEWPYEHRSDSRIKKRVVAPLGFLQCQDGYIFFVGIEDHHWQGFLEMIGNPDWGQNERFKDRFVRAENYDILEPLILEWTMRHTVIEITGEARKRKLPLGAVSTIADTVEATQLKARNFWSEWEHPVLGKIKYPGPPHVLPKTPWSIRKPAPLLGQHNKEIYCSILGYSEEELVKLYETQII